MHLYSRTLMTSTGAGLALKSKFESGRAGALDRFCGISSHYRTASRRPSVHPNKPFVSPVGVSLLSVVQHTLMRTTMIIVAKQSCTCIGRLLSQDSSAPPPRGQVAEHRLAGWLAFWL